MSILNYVYAYGFTFIGIIITGVLTLLFFTDDLIMHPSKYLILLLVIYFLGRYTLESYKPLIRKYFFIVQLNYALIPVLVICSWIYYIWEIDFIQASTMAKLSLLFLGFAALYGFFILKRATYAMNKKVKNPRIENQEKQTYFERIREAEKRLSSDEPYFVMGIDIDTPMDDDE